uniref:Nuclease HARBI1 n=1 Tax=Cacopsylla melanoneura TaxID=428564 RepID=A0A8D8TQD9_9HEMI
MFFTYWIMMYLLLDSQGICSFFFFILALTLCFFIPDTYVDSDYFNLFRMTRRSFAILLNLLVVHGDYRTDWTKGKEPVNPEKMLQIFLRHMGSKEGIREISDRFNVAISTVFQIRRRSIKAVLNLLPLLIKWPSRNDFEIIEQEFNNFCGFPGVIGAIDGSHIPIKVTNDIADSYKNRKMQHSIILQAVCTSRRLFTGNSD